MKNVWFAFVMILAFGVLATACGTNEETADGKLKVTSTIGMITDVARHIGGEHVNVTGLMKEGTDPHLYKATQGDIKRLESADLILYNGLHLEAAMAEVIGNMDKPTVAVGEHIDVSRLIGASDYPYDPHIWFDVQLWMQASEAIRDALIEQDPDNEQSYRDNAEAYLAKLQELDDYARTQIASIPKESRVMITAHDAFSYFGKAYDIDVRGLQGISTASEAGVKDVADLRDFIIERGIKAIFVETSVSGASIEAVIEGAKAKGYDLKEGGSLFSDAMGAEGTEEGTYIGMVRHNVDTIVGALK